VAIGKIILITEEDKDGKREMETVVAGAGLFLGILSFLIVGEAVLWATRIDRNSLSGVERLAVIFVLGNGAIALEMFTFILANAPLQLTTLMAPWVLIDAIRICIWWTGTGHAPQQVTARAREIVNLRWLKNDQALWYRFSAAAVLALATIVLLGATFTVPFLYGDDIAFWLPKAKVIYHHRLSPFAAFHDLSEFFQPDYPLLLPLTETWLFLWIRESNEYLLKALFPIYLIFLGLGTWGFVRRFSGSKAATVALGLLVTTPIILFQGATGYAEIPLTLYYWLATALLLTWFQTRASSTLALAAICLGLTGWIKNEGLGLILLNSLVFAAYLVLERRSDNIRIRHAALLFGGITGAIIMPWLFARHSLGLRADLSLWPAALGMSHFVQRLFFIARAFARSMFGRWGVFGQWNVIWYLLAFTVILWRRAFYRPPLIYPVLLISGQILLYVWIYLAMPYDVNLYLNTTLDRLLIHLYPFVCWIVGWSVMMATKGNPSFQVSSSDRA
jgi:hypothetical protein